MLNTNYPATDQVKLNNGKGVMLNIEQIRDDILSLTFPGAPVVAVPHLVLTTSDCMSCYSNVWLPSKKLSWRSIWKPWGLLHKLSANMLTLSFSVASQSLWTELNTLSSLYIGSPGLYQDMTIQKSLKLLGCTRI